ncbi:hypothetical protein AAG906_007152 [Vitis piasezkii]
MMSYSPEKQPSVAGYPPQLAATAYPAGPPAGYPMKDGHDYPQNKAAVKTKAKGKSDDGFWKGLDGGVEDDDLEAFTSKEDGDKETGEENDNKKVMEVILSGHNHVGKGIAKEGGFGGKQR